MPDIDWNEGTPSDTESAGLGDDRIRSLKTSLRVGLDAEHAWSSSGLGVGVHRLGSARPYYGPQSLVSSSGTDARLMVTSDTSRLFHVGSAGTMFLGGANVLSVGSAPVGGQRSYWAIETGIGRTTGAGGILTVAVPNSGYSGIPFVTVTAEDAGQAGFYANLNAPPTPTVISITGYLKGGTVSSGITVHWMSIGSRTF